MNIVCKNDKSKKTHFVRFATISNGWTSLLPLEVNLRTGQQYTDTAQQQKTFLFLQTLKAK